MSPFLVLFSFLLFSSATAFNITRILNQYPEFSTFNSLLTQTRLAAAINNRRTITVLAVDDGAISAVSGKPEDIAKRILSVHVVLDYYDMEKLKKISMRKKRSTLLTTLFQSTGLARNQQGFINITIPKLNDDGDFDGGIMLGSASPGSGLNSNLLKPVVARPYNISVFQISSVIIPPGIEDEVVPPPPKKAPSHSPKRAPSPAPESDAPAPSDESDSPVSSPPEPEGPIADGPGADGPAADGPSEPDIHSSSWRVRVTWGTCIGVVMGVLCVLAL
ncbi:fasciclin-like arabinogalactan protein 14 [Cinnamomum micranthum f. kanehirae]|uniref:Fasciclin-like arabinogalactan protein 14 n=1 Tax=Cinnamomum micranthum f. kanehirae TaxID=337451 RepID=A0A3S3N8A6_9MAGN|nr:fasciclin-like arabinogalactan protein 14 [Cinnamomum micranthum f. kanehirae]